MSSADMKLSDNFRLGEFYTHDGTRVPDSHVEALKRVCRYVLEPMRKKYGPCRVHSGYRHRGYNAGIGGARNSFHIYDEHDPTEVAVDVSFVRGNPKRWRRSANYRLRRKFKRGGGIGYYPRGGFIHIDTRRNGAARWDGP